MLKVHGRVLFRGAMCAALMALAMAICAEQADARSAVAATAARSCEHTQLATAKRSLSSAHMSRLQQSCAKAHKSLTTVSYFRSRKHRWMIAPRYHKWWQVPGERWRQVVRHSRAILRFHERRLALMVNRITALLPHPQPVLAQDWLYQAFLCIHRGEGAWNADTGNGYYGGLQMDYGFMSTYGPEYLKRWGTADKWPASVQILVSERAYRSGRGFGPWPNTARGCGLL